MGPDYAMGGMQRARSAAFATVGIGRAAATIFLVMAPFGPRYFLEKKRRQPAPVGAADMRTANIR
jgi:hypothetical protein